MSFFKDFKEDAMQALNELMPGSDPETEVKDEALTREEVWEEDIMVNTLDASDLDVKSELSKLDGLLEKVTQEVNSPVSAVEQLKAVEEKTETLAQPEEKKQTIAKPAIEVTAVDSIIEEKETTKEDKMVSDLEKELGQVDTLDATTSSMLSGEVSDEVSVITEGTVLKGNLESTGSFDIRGTINGDVTCNGKMNVTGTMIGNSTSSEFFADAAKVEGEVVSTGTVKVGFGSVIIGNITATSAVIAGAIKGDIDVQGPVVVDSSAVVMGNIKSRSVQINNGAVIEGFCSQCYAEVDVESLFGDKKVQ